MKLSRILAVAFCAAIAPAAARAQTTASDLPPLMEDNGTSMRADPSIRIIEHRFAVSADSVWAILPDVLREMGIEPQVDPSRERVMGNVRITAPRVAGERTGRYMACGNENSGPASAGQFRIRLNLVTQVRAEEQGSRTFTRLIGTANSVNGSGNQVVGCTSTGALERKLGEAIAARLAAPAPAAAPAN
ncbi:hypothetical protein [Longimicrobium terrae]|uniref:DUF4410 domain-containing protein n=1 Tax=Longimicrobium terrae TaxID=1639882 RepID=A0A841GQK4_9BACT|nr:hypothetical protein [Longimicrobium terrae]MBB4635388.1 hypothetical protein [Longimicrobium terrae]MBB6069782.1 hypothetical protein [Longimicrobium terrae]NNC31009.1 hypothetical protein [Longimicrobium terrae]